MCLFAASAWAQQSQDSYRIEAKVANQSEAERIAAAKANMGEVIQRITGDASSLQHPLVRQAISDAPNYLAKFNYPTDTSIVLNFSPQDTPKLFSKLPVSRVFDTKNKPHVLHHFETLAQLLPEA